MVAFEDIQHSLPFLAGVALLAYVMVRAVYRLYLSPIAKTKIPGPKLAALTLWYEFWYDVVQRGQYTFRIREMHDKYGPIVQVSPYEIHINDPDFYLELYTGNVKRREKYPWALRMFGMSKSALSTVNHEEHRMRRSAMNRFFSKESVHRLEPILREKFEKLLYRLETYKGTDKPLNINLPFSAFTRDIITCYSFAKSYNYLDPSDFNEAFFDMIACIHELAPVAKQFGAIPILMDALPDWLVERIDHGMNLWCRFRREMRANIKDIIKNRDQEKEHYKSLSHPTVFHDILDSDLPA